VGSRLAGVEAEADQRIDALAAVVLAAYFAAQDTTSVYQTRELLVGG
jgi:presenilin-like A22 family membrane protease